MRAVLKLIRGIGIFLAAAIFVGIAATFGLNALLLQLNSSPVPGRILKKLETIDVSRTGSVRHRYFLKLQELNRLEVNARYYDSVREGQTINLRQNKSQLFGRYAPRSLYTRIEGQSAVEPLLIALTNFLPSTGTTEPTMRTQATIESIRNIDLFLDGTEGSMPTVRDFSVIVFSYLPSGYQEAIRAYDCVDKGSFASFHAGDSVEVLYQASDPRRAQFAIGARNYWWINWSPFVLLAFGLMVLYFWRR